MSQSSSTTDILQVLPWYRRILYLVKKLIVYLFRYADNPKYLFLYLSKVISRSYKENANFYNDEQFLNEATSRSTIRLGDGEFGLLLGKRGIHYQSTDPKLQKLLLQAINNYSDNSPYLLGLPFFINIPNKILHKHNFKYLWLPAKVLYRILFQKQPHYFNSHYFYIENNVTNFLQITSTNRDVIFVTNEQNVNGIKNIENDLFPHSLSINYISTPKQDTFAVYDSLFQKIISMTQAHNHPTIFVACGPAGKALAYESSMKDLIAHDIGHGIEFALNKKSQEHQVQWDVFESYWQTISNT